MTECITATNIKYYWLCPRLFELVYIKKQDPFSRKTGSTEDILHKGEVLHKIVLNTLRELQALENPTLPAYQALLKKQAYDHRLGMDAGLLKEFQHSLRERTIFERLGVGIERVGAMRIEESFYTRSPKVHAMPDVVVDGDVYDLKTGIAPVEGVAAVDCVSTVASALPVGATYVKEPRVFVVYTRAADGPREVSYQEWLPEVQRCIKGIQAMEFPKNKASSYCSRCSCGKTNPL